MSAKGKPHPKEKFTPAEDAKLKALVKFIGVGSWNKVAEYMGTRNARQCRDRYKNYLAPNLNIKPWTLEDDEKLNRLIETMGKKWSLVAKEFPGRTDINIKSRYALLQRQLARDQQLNSKQCISFDELSFPTQFYSTFDDISVEPVLPELNFYPNMDFDL